MTIKRNILITGGLGRIGSKAALHLAMLGYNITVTDVAISPDKLHHLKGHDHIQVVEQDVFEPSGMAALLKDQDIVLHLACTTLPDTSEANPARDIQANVVGTLHLFEACCAAGVDQFVFPSSGGTVYGDTPSIPTSEEVLPHPLSFHGAMKLSTEHFLRAAEKKGNTRCTILRISNPYGIGYLRGKSQGVIDVFTTNLKEGRPIQIWGDVDIVRDYIHIDDLINAFAAVFEKQTESRLFNIGTGVGISLDEILRELSAYFDLTDKIIRLPPRDFDVHRSVLDITRARTELDWQPRITLQEGIRRLVHE